jgi:hypothetical protein
MKRRVSVRITGPRKGESELLEKVLDEKDLPSDIHLGQAILQEDFPPDGRAVEKLYSGEATMTITGGDDRKPIRGDKKAHDDAWLGCEGHETSEQFEKRLDQLRKRGWK